VTLLRAAQRLLEARDRMLQGGNVTDQHLMDKAWLYLEKIVSDIDNHVERDYDDLQWDEEDMK
jgi:hypothetical protein